MKALVIEEEVMEGMVVGMEEEGMVVGDGEGRGGDGEGSYEDHSDGVMEGMMAWPLQKGAVKVLVLVSVFRIFQC